MSNHENRDQRHDEHVRNIARVIGIIVAVAMVLCFAIPALTA
ncbi:hypothetical protein [Bifidobacterium magnum]|nr:hypothetical protein [Bifidobacterium magnum]